MKLEFSQKIFEKKNSNVNFHENPASGSRAVPRAQRERETVRQRGLRKPILAILRNRPRNGSSACPVRLHHLCFFSFCSVCITATGHKNIYSLRNKSCTNQNKLKVTVDPLTSMKTYRDLGSTVVKVLCYKSESRRFDPRWCHWI